MPLRSYTMIHKNARLSTKDKAQLIEWTTKTEDSLKLKN
jgi:hypothetical protein